MRYNVNASGVRTVLVVDDIPATRFGLIQLLELRGYHARGAADGGEALEVLRADPTICLVILDLAMPAKDGCWFRQHQVEDSALASIPVVVFSGMPTDALPRALAGIEVLAKPVAVDRVIELVTRHCDAA